MLWYILRGVLLIWRLVSDTAAASLLYSGGPLAEKLLAGLPDTKHTRNLPYLTVESPSGDPLPASISCTF
jgi:hypothetical protein